MDSNSASEGEIIESEHEIEKATKDQSTTNRKEINRKPRDAFSPSSESDASYRSQASGKSRDRSRSPHRYDRDYRGWKRLQDNGSYSSHISDSRRYPAQYDGSYDREPYRRSYTYADWDGKRNRNTHQADAGYRMDRLAEKKRRTRSRSPRGARVRNEDLNRTIHSRNGDRSHKSQESLNHRPKTENSFSTMQNNGNATYRTMNGLDGSRMTNSGIVEDSMQEVKEAQEPSEPKTEEMSIEERRKRREAIKARHKADPLLVQVLQHSNQVDTPTTSKPTSTAASSRSGSPDGSTPSTPLHESPQGSPPPIEISNDTDLANIVTAGGGEDIDEPSAADYDPTMDMQEDRERGNQLQLEKTMSAQSHDNTTHATQPAPSSEKKAKPAGSQSKKRKADDMFASDDEDNMFADADPESSKGSTEAKELDMSLLDNWDDPNGYYRIILSELLDGRYVVQSNLGKGMFSSVIRAIDNHIDQLVAIKIIRNNESMLKAGTKEMEILQKLAAADPDDKKHVIRLERSFVHKGHLCMVFENLSINLREVLKKFGRDVGIQLKAVRSYAQQMFLALSLLRKCNILHADLKPDNILVNEARSALKICDLGSAADASENDITPYLVSRFYRAPEIILGVPYDFAIDMWSIGCTLFELATGKILFTGRTNNQMLRSIMECRGKFSLKMLKKAEFGAVHFDDANLHFRSVERDKITNRDVTKLINFVKPTRDLKTRLLNSALASNGSRKLPETEMKELNLFVDLLDRCLALNPEKRITPTEALKHPFIYRSTGTGGGSSKR